MKKIYFKPEVQVLAVDSQTFVLAGNDSNTIPPGEPNQPAGARSFGAWADGEEE